MDRAYRSIVDATCLASYVDDASLLLLLTTLTLALPLNGLFQRIAMVSCQYAVFLVGFVAIA